MSLTQKNILTSWCAKAYCPGIANAWEGKKQKGGKGYISLKPVQTRSNMRLVDWICHSWCEVRLSALSASMEINQFHFSMAVMCIDLTEFHQLSAYPQPPLTMSRNSITNRCLIGQNTLHQNLGQWRFQWVKNVSFNLHIKILTLEANYQCEYLLFRALRRCCFNTYLQEQHLLYLLSALKYEVHCFIITQMCPSSGGNMTNEQRVTKTLPNEPFQLLSFWQTGYNYSLITPIRLLTWADCCGANTAWTPAVTALGR